MEEQTASSTKEIKLFSGPGTRQWPRFDISEVPSIRGIRSSAGSRIKVANISRGGALLQIRRNQVPGTRIRLHIETTEGITQLNSIVVRSDGLAPNEILRHQAAVAFNRPLQIPDNPVIPLAETPQTALYPSPIPQTFSATHDEPSFQSTCSEDLSMIEAFLSIEVYNDPDEELDKMLMLNNW